MVPSGTWRSLEGAVFEIQTQKEHFKLFIFFYLKKIKKIGAGHFGGRVQTITILIFIYSNYCNQLFDFLTVW